MARIRDIARVFRAPSRQTSTTAFYIDEAAAIPDLPHPTLSDIDNRWLERQRMFNESISDIRNRGRETVSHTEHLRVGLQTDRQGRSERVSVDVQTPLHVRIEPGESVREVEQWLAETSQLLVDHMAQVLLQEVTTALRQAYEGTHQPTGRVYSRYQRLMEDMALRLMPGGIDFPHSIDLAAGAVNYLRGKVEKPEVATPFEALAPYKDIVVSRFGLTARMIPDDLALYNEGEVEMEHCVFKSYLPDVKRGEYMVFHITPERAPGEKRKHPRSGYTCAFRRVSNGWDFTQIRGKKNDMSYINGNGDIKVFIESLTREVNNVFQRTGNK